MSLLGTVIGDYKILRKVGSGGMGVVYQGVHVRLDQPVAIKDLAPELASDPEMRQRFIREARIQAKLNHPNVVNVHNLLEHEGRLLLVMEYVEGETLDKLIQDKGALSNEKAIEISRQVLDALSFMHARGVIHRDLKPGNIMLSEGGRVKVTDFGIAKATTEKGQTRAGVRLGTLWYMSPEQIRGKSVDARSDLYAMGVTLFQMVTGKLPFFGNSDFEIMKAHTEMAPPDPKKIKKDIPKPLSTIILKLLEKDPDKRFQSADDVLKALENIKKGPTPSAKKDKAPNLLKSIKESPFKSGEKPPVWIWIAIAALLVAAGGIILTYWILNRKSSVIPVVKKPAIEKKVVAFPAPSSSSASAQGTAQSVGKKTSDEENVAPVLQEIEQEEKSTSTEKAEKENPPQAKTKAAEEPGTQPAQKIEQQESPSGKKNMAEMTPTGHLKHASTPTPKETSKQKKKPSITHRTKPRQTTVEAPPPGNLKKEKKHVASSSPTVEKPKNSHQKKGDRMILNKKRLGYFFKSLKKSLNDLEHQKVKEQKKEASKHSSSEKNTDEMDEAFH